MTTNGLPNLHYHNAIKSTQSSAVYTPSTSIVTAPLTDKYTIGDNIGRGKFAVVKQCTNKGTGEVLAAKFIKKRRRGKSCREEILREVVMLEMALDHPRLVNLKEVYETPQELILITEYCAGGELFTECVLEEKFNEADVRLLMSQILEGLVYLHEKNIVHLDLKPQNILLTHEYPSGSVKICDLGFACLVNTGEDIRDIIGTPDYVAPEVLNYDPLGLYTDMWSLGVLTYVMLTTCSPFAAEDKNQTFCNITTVNLDFPDDLFADISEAAVDFIKKLLLAEPSERMTAPQCMDHEWLYDIFHAKDYHLPFSHSNANLISMDSELGTDADDRGELSDDESGGLEMKAVKSEGDLRNDEMGCVVQTDNVVVKLGDERRKKGVGKSDSRGKIENQTSEMSVVEDEDTTYEPSDVVLCTDDENSRLSVSEPNEIGDNPTKQPSKQDTENNTKTGNRKSDLINKLTENCDANISWRYNHGDSLPNVDAHVDKEKEHVKQISDSNKNASEFSPDDISPDTDSSMCLSDSRLRDLDSGLGTVSDSKSVESLNAQFDTSGRPTVEFDIDEHEDELNLNEGESNILSKSHFGEQPVVSAFSENQSGNKSDTNEEGKVEDSSLIGVQEINERDTDHHMDISEEGPTFMNFSNNNASTEFTFNKRLQSQPSDDSSLNQSTNSDMFAMSFEDFQKPFAPTSTPSKTPTMPASRGSIGSIDDSVNCMQIGERLKRGMCNDNTPTSGDSRDAINEEDYEFISVSKRVRSIEDSMGSPITPPFSPKIQRSPRIRRHDRSQHHHHH
ncbi:probable serine/threonine-protein kinase fhkE [Mya arenaria]|uniref:probable serine/threonine-protein kinase fhkE n=1 Tax=Mya arenaria TaxID=6604 RepID=UPI0022E95805|nr:probable serine/threonine-protein kinase fhkE [Mya arenaria]